MTIIAAVSSAFHESPDRRGLFIWIIPCKEDSVSPKSGYPNKWVEIPIFTHLPLSGEQCTELLSRNHVNVLTADVIVALPGHAGTASEVALALSYDRPIVAFLNSADEIPGLPDRVPVRSNFDEVCEFVQSRLDHGPTTRSS